MREGDSSEELNSSTGNDHTHQRNEPDSHQGESNNRPPRSHGNQEERRSRGVPGRGRFRGGPHPSRGMAEQVYI
jgi:hypothetical protein